MMKFVWLLSIVACSSPAGAPPKPATTTPTAPVTAAPNPTAAPEPPPLSNQAPPQRAPAPTCVKAELTVYESTVVGDSVKLCFLDNDVVDCWTFSLATNTWAPHDRHPYVPSDGVDGPVTVKGSTIAACKPDGSDCRSIPFSPAPQADESVAAWASSDRSLVALLVGLKPIRVFDATGKQLSTIKGWPTKMSDPGTPAFFREARFVGSTLAAYIADTPMTSAIRLFDPRTGKKLGDVNAGRPMSDVTEPVDLGSDRFAFVEFDTSAIVVQDVKTGKLVKRYAIAGAEPAGYAMMVRSPDGKGLVAAENTRILRLDLATGSVVWFPAPRCPS